MSSSTFGWTPLFSTIIDSSVWRESKETRLVWITLLAKKNKEGFVRASMWALARDAGVTEDECRDAIKVLEAPDPDSHCKDNEGRRIAAVDGGWMVLNHLLYRDMVSKAKQREQQAAWQKNYRERQKLNIPEGSCLKSITKKMVNEDPITKSDKAEMKRKCKTEEGDPLAIDQNSGNGNDSEQESE
jgi:hypothetical protein